MIPFQKPISIVLLTLFLFTPIAADPLTRTEKELLESHPRLIDVTTLNRDILVDLKYATKDNFSGKILYENLTKCFLVKDAAEKLDGAQKLLAAKNPGYHLKVFDCLRPRSVQYGMWEIVKGTEQQMYVANPDKISIHNYGAAVDLTVVNDEGKELDMGVPFDYFGPLAQPRKEDEYLKKGKLTRKQIDNRHLLRSVMETSGFQQLAIEWWHFNSMAPAMIRARYTVIP